MDKVFREHRNIVDFNYRDNIDYPPHIHDDVEICYVFEGSVNASCDGKKYLITAGKFFIAFPNQIHSYENCDVRGKYFVTVFPKSVLLQYKDIFDDRVPANSVFSCKGDTGKLVNIIDAFAAKFYDESNDIQSLVITLFFGEVIRHVELSRRNITRDTVINVINYCTSHYKEEISVGSIAKALSISKSYVSYIFGSCLMINFCEYINRLRISEAKNYLIGERYSVTQVADMVGFNTIRTFNRSFYKTVGMTPTEYKKMFKTEH